MSETAISLSNVGKRYVKYEDAPMLVTRVLRARTRRSRLWALRGIDFEVARGESVGLIGRNGAGKSTMLRLLAGVTAPTEGTVRVGGRVAPLIAVGVGFHPELTGRENVLVNGIVLGLTRQEVARRFDQIVDFAGIGDFIDTPVKFYSSGMAVRLGFSVAVASDPEVLLVDEVLAVGDIAFQRKCFDRMLEIRDAGATIVVVSHNLSGIRTLCPRTAVMHHGRIELDGRTDDAISKFHDLLARDGGRTDDGDEVGVAARVVSWSLLDATKQPTNHVAAGDDAVFRAEIDVLRPCDHAVFNVVIASEDGTAVYSETTPLLGSQRHRAGERVEVSIRMRLSLVTGSYTARLSGVADGVPFFTDPGPILFYVAGRPRVHGVADLGADFRITTDGDDSDTAEAAGG